MSKRIKRIPTAAPRLLRPSGVYALGEGDDLVAWSRLEAGEAFSIWLTPQGEPYQVLAELIADISKRLHSPCFPPHVTLLGSLRGSAESLKLKCAELASRLKPYKISLGKIQYTDDYSRSLFYLVERTQDVLRANLLAKEIFDRATDLEYLPHLSILYGIFPSSTKEILTEELGSKVTLSFRAEDLQLVDTSGKPENWFALQKFLFGRRTC